MPAPDERFPPDPAVEAYKKDVVRTLLRERLKRTPEERLEDLVATSPACCARCTKAGSR